MKHEAERNIRLLHQAKVEQRRDEGLVNAALATITHRAGQIGKTVEKFTVTIGARLSLAELKQLDFKLRQFHRLMISQYMAGCRWRFGRSFSFYC